MKTTSMPTPSPRGVAACCLVLFAMGLLTLCLTRVYRQHQIIRAGYELSEARSTLRKLDEENNRLKVEENMLTDPGRIEALANGLGMVRPAPEQLRVITTNKPVAQR
jgi:cell division protein FtsL